MPEEELRRREVERHVIGTMTREKGEMKARKKEEVRIRMVRREEALRKRLGDDAASIHGLGRGRPKEGVCRR